MLWEEAPGRSSRDLRKNIFLGCQSRARSDLVVKLQLGSEFEAKVPPRVHDATITGFRDLTPTIREFDLAVAGEAKFLPGQYAIFQFDDGALRRCYSMSNLPNRVGLWQFQIKHVPGGAGTGRLFSMCAGDELTLDGPYGLAYARPDSARDVLCVAGGSGISPMISIARSIGLDEGQSGKRLHFYYGGRTVEDICGRDYLEDLPGFGERIFFHAAISEPDDERCRGWTGATGFVHEAVDQALGEQVKDLEIYFAGPPPMARAIQEMLVLKHKVAFDQIHFDRFF